MPVTLIADPDNLLAEYAAVLLELETPTPTYDDDPQGWLTETTGEYAWSVQRDIWQSVHENTYTAVLSCNGSGKTWLAARVVAKWVAQYWREGVRVVTTAPTAAQVSLLLWQEIRTAYDLASANGQRLPGRLVMSPFPQWKIGNKTVGFGRKPADHEQSALQGVHAPHVLVVLDEACGVGPNIWTAVTKITTTGHVSILAIGNPDDPTSNFHKVTRPTSDWNVIRVDGLRTPNFTAEAVADLPLTRALMESEHIPYSTEPIPEAIRTSMLRPSFVEDQIVQLAGVSRDLADRLPWGDVKRQVVSATQASQLFTTIVRGEFPDGGATSMIPLGWLMRAVERWRDWRDNYEQDHDPPGRRIVGVDVATDNGADETAIAVRQREVVYTVERYPQGDTIFAAERALLHTLAGAGGAAVVDVIGIGAGVADQLRHAGVTTIPFNASAQSDRTDRWGQFRFLNDRAAAWWRLREMLDPTSGHLLCIPDDDRLISELTAPKWKLRTAKGYGIIQMEAKAEIKKRLGHSTDSADAVVQSVWIDGMAPKDLAAAAGAIPWGGNTRTPAATTTATGGAIAYTIGDGTENW